MVNKLVKFSIITGVVIISVSIAYFFIFFLPNHLEKKEESENNLKCQEAASKLHKEYEKKFEDASLEEPTFKFSKKLNTCLYKSEMFIRRPYKPFHFFIIDVYTNKIIWHCIPFLEEKNIDTSGDKTLVSWEEFEKKSRELFGD